MSKFSFGDCQFPTTKIHLLPTIFIIDNNPNSKISQYYSYFQIHFY